MIIKNYEELKVFLEGSQELRIGESKISNNGESILKYDDNGIYTSYPNEELKNSKFIIRKKHLNAEIPEHRHEYMEIVYIFEGEVHKNIEGKEITMKKGDICVMDKNVIHSNKPLGENDLAINILLTTEMFDTVFMHLLSDDNYISNFIINSFYSTNKSKKYIIHKIEENTFTESVLINLVCEYFSDSICCQGKIKGCLLLLFTELSRALNENKKVEMKTSKVKADIVDYLQREYKEMSLLKAANHFHFHPNYLSSLVKKEFGKNFKDLLVDIRMVEAGKLLRTTDLKISSIGELIGYTNEAYFYRQFKKKYNETPYEYRKHNILKKDS